MTETTITVPITDQDLPTTSGLLSGDIPIAEEVGTINVELRMPKEGEPKGLTVLVPGLGEDYNHELMQAISQRFSSKNAVASLGNITELTAWKNWEYSIFQSIQGVLKQDSQLKNKPVMIVGHSLGATAVLGMRRHLLSGVTHQVLLACPLSPWKFVEDNKDRFAVGMGGKTFGRRKIPVQSHEYQLLPDEVQAVTDFPVNPNKGRSFFGNKGELVTLISVEGDTIVSNEDSEWLASELAKCDRLSESVMLSAPRDYTTYQRHNFQGELRGKLIDILSKIV